MRNIFIVLLIFLSLNTFAQRSSLTRSYNDTTIIILQPKPKIVEVPKVSKLDSFVCYWVGKPYIYGGTTQKGIDCSGFTQKLFNDIFNIYIPRTAYEQYKKSIKIPFEQIKMGDLIFFSSKLSPSGWHVAFYLGNNMIFHSANRKVGVVIETITNNMKNKVYAVGRFLNT